MPRRKPKAKAIPYIDTKAKGTHHTALHFAVLNNQPEAVKLLIEKGANIEAPDAMKMTPLHIAASRGFLEVVRGTCLVSDLTTFFKLIDFLQCWLRPSAISKPATSSSVLLSFTPPATATSWFSAICSAWYTRPYVLYSIDQCSEQP